MAAFLELLVDLPLNAPVCWEGDRPRAQHRTQILFPSGQHYLTSSQLFDS